MALTVVDGGLLSSTNAQYTGMKNRIINGAMVIDQRNAGAAFGTSINGYTLDRWNVQQSVTGKLNGGQNYNSITPPAGFTKYIGVQSQSAYSILTSDYYGINQSIEGFNCGDLAWGTASAATITLSFWVRSSLTGTFGGSLRNVDSTRSYPFTYTISAANTWEQKSITIAGDTSGTWNTTNSLGMLVYFGLGMGTTYASTAGAWATGNYASATGATSVVGTNGATWYITGVQLEKGSTATSFDYRPYGTELALCQRYFVKETGYNVKAATRYGASLVVLSYSMPVEMRTTPTATNTNNWNVINSAGTESSTTSTVNTIFGFSGGSVDVVLNTSFNPAVYVYTVYNASSTSVISFSAEL